MINIIKPTGTVGIYSTDDATHYSWHNLPPALQQFEGLIATYPDAAEADYSRMQIHNIINTVISKLELMVSQVKLARAYFETSRRV
ncbi:MAG: hypothetical protein ACKVT0_13065 [Planctomycetaceae bacterium]